MDVERFRTARERCYPYAAGLLLGVVALVWKARGGNLDSIGVDAAAVISVTFNMMVTLTAFLFSVFVLAVAPGGGFIERIFGSNTFRIFKRYVIEALLLGLISMLLCIPFMIIKVNAEGSVWKSPIAQSIWVVFAVAACLGFYRVAHSFLVIVGQEARLRRKRRRPA